MTNANFDSAKSRKSANKSKMILFGVIEEQEEEDDEVEERFME